MPYINENPNTPTAKPTNREFLELYFNTLETANPIHPVAKPSPISSFLSESALSSCDGVVYSCLIY